MVGKFSTFPAIGRMAVYTDLANTQRLVVWIISAVVILLVTGDAITSNPIKA